MGETKTERQVITLRSGLTLLCIMLHNTIPCLIHRLVELGLSGRMALAASYFTHNKQRCKSRWKKLKQQDKLCYVFKDTNKFFMFSSFSHRLVELGMSGSMALAASYFTHNKQRCKSRWKKLKQQDKL